MFRNVVLDYREPTHTPSSVQKPGNLYVYKIINSLILKIKYK